MINNIIPTPKKVTNMEGVTFVSPVIDVTEDAWRDYGNTICEAFAKLFRITLKSGKGGITLKKDETLPPKSYRYDSREGVTLYACDDEGILYALSTLLQTVTVKGGKISLTKAVIEDYPEKDFRALMVDLARAWHPADTVYKYIDLCFALKIKYLHLHFIDNERYTLPSRAFPKLNDIDSYTYLEIAEMRRRAKSRGIIIIPEFEAPGHAARLTASYPDCFANELCSDVAAMTTENGVAVDDRSIICAGKENTFEAIKTLLSEVAELFPDAPYIHIGGDEANIKVWNSCRHCVKYMEENDIEDVYELYSEFVGKIARAVLELGKTPIVWEGFPKKGVHHIPKETVVIAWESLYHMAYDLIAEGFKVINASWRPLYVVPAPEMDWGIPEILDWNVYNWQHWYVRSEAHLNPINVTPTEQVIGAELCLWECTFEQEIGSGMNNLAALSERTWTVKRQWESIDFINRAKPTLNRIARYIQSV